MKNEDPVEFWLNFASRHKDLANRPESQKFGV